MTSDIQKLICKSEILKGNLACENVSHLLSWECDVLSLNKSGYLTEFEVKVSRSDFLAEKRKVRKWMLMDAKEEWTCPNYFCYVCPSGLFTVDEIPDYAGLITISDNELTVVKSPKMIHKQKKDREKVLSKFCRVITERTYLGGCRLTYENNLIRERNAKHLAKQTESVFGT